MIIFYRESNNFDDILKDKNIKGYLRTKLKFNEHLIIELDENKKDHNKILSYIGIKYGDSIKTKPITSDYIPKIGIDYVSKVPEHLKDQRRK